MSAGAVVSGVLVAAALVPALSDGPSATAVKAAAPSVAGLEALPTWQVNGVVWSMTTVGNTVYATGNFTKARPPGVAAGGQGEVTRNNILAFDITTGNLITSFNHSLNGQGLRITRSPDGKRVYVGGEFTEVDGQPRSRLAAFNTSNGALDTGFKPAVSAKVRGIAATNSTVYFGGNFFNVNGKSRNRLAAVKAADGANIDAWKPVVDDEIHAMVMAPGDKRVIIGGKFQNVNSAAKVGVGALDAATGASAPWSSRPVPTRLSADRNFSYVTDLAVQGDTVYASANGEGYHWFDGRFAAKAETGDLVWLDNCYGATYGIFPQGDTVYSVSHAHDCSSLGAFKETTPQTFYRALAETAYATGTDQSLPGSNSNYRNQPIPSLLNWYPKLAMGTFTKQYQAAWAVTGNSAYIAMGGEFPRVNDKNQAGLVRFVDKSKLDAKPVAVASESFPKTITNGFGTAATGGAWTATGAAGALSTSGGIGRIKLTKKGAWAGAVLNDVKSQKSDLTFKFAADKAGKGSGVAAIALGRTVPGAGDYRARVRMTGSSVYLQLARANTKNTETVIAREAQVKGVTFTPRKSLRIRFQVFGGTPTTVRARVWADGAKEPTTWNLSVNDSTEGLQTAGGMGVRGLVGNSDGNVPITVGVDAFYGLRNP
ncbi:delta-60 repeat domain-containing protein [Spirillospora sp. NPDC047279]|uniref:delta-60 repeat domain-containing protein n=1 Tax=Spirillospora sp. NPDC047279 TaxID=3155478 RepID=UPI0033EC5347